MKVIKEKILVEELQGLILGKTIDFLELDSHKLKIQISGEDVKGFFQKDVEDMDTEYLKNQKEIITRELDKRNKNKTFCIVYREEFEATVEAKTTGEAIRKFQNSECEIDCCGNLWEEYMKIEEC